MAKIKLKKGWLESQGTATSTRTEFCRPWRIRPTRKMVSAFGRAICRKMQATICNRYRIRQRSPPRKEGTSRSCGARASGTSAPITDSSSPGMALRIAGKTSKIHFSRLESKPKHRPKPPSISTKRWRITWLCLALSGTWKSLRRVWVFIKAGIDRSWLDGIYSKLF